MKLAASRVRLRTDPPAKSLPTLLLKYQRDWISDKADVAVWEKSRRIGASWTMACQAVLESAPTGGQDSLYIGYSEDMTREFVDDCSMWAKSFEYVAGEINETLFDDTDEHGETRQIKAFRIDFASGRKILALSSRPRSIRGKQGLVIIDEAAFHDDLQGLLKAALALLIWGGLVRVLSSHNGDSNYFNQIIQDIRAGKLPFALHRTTLDDALADGLFKRVCLKMGNAWSAEGEAQWRAALLKRYGDAADEELFCIPREGGGAYLTRAMIERCMVSDAPVLRWKAPKGFVMWAEHLRAAEVHAWCESALLPELKRLDPNLRSFVGGDFGRLVDLSVFSPGQIQQNLKRRINFMVELADTPFEQQKQIFFYIADRLPRFFAGKLDARGNGHYLAEVAMQRYGIKVEGVMLSELWYRENTPAFKAAYEDNTIEHPRDADVLDDLRAFEVIRGVARIPDKRSTGADGQKRHGDAGISLLLAHAASRADFVPIEFQALNAARAGSRLSDYQFAA